MLSAAAAPYVANLLALGELVSDKLPYTTLQQAVHIHPTVSELIPTMLGELAPAG